jgi:hypothetical protein
MHTYIHPKEFNFLLESLIKDGALRQSLGKQAQNFVRTYWKPRQVAERYLSIIHNKAPEQWWCDPQTIDYLHGWGLSETHVRQLLGLVLKEGGRAALQVCDKPRLEEALVKFAQDSPRNN